MPGIQFLRGLEVDDSVVEYILLRGKGIKWSLLIPTSQKTAHAWRVDYPSFLALLLVRLLEAEEAFDVFLLTDEAGSTAAKLCRPGADFYWFLLGDKLKAVDDLSELPFDILRRVGASFPAPILLSLDGKQVVAGPCAVLRELLVEFSLTEGPWKEQAAGLLGFRGGCLSAPSQTSPWARFCETDAPGALSELKAAAEEQNDDDLPIVIPAALARLEEHFNHPIRCHNIRKQKQDEKLRNGEPIDRNPNSDPPGWKKIEERYVEGPWITLADVMLLASMYLAFYCLNRSVCKKLLPNVNDWMKRISLDKHVGKAIPILNEAARELPKAVKVSTILPTVPAETLYKRDPERYNPKHRIYTRQGKLEEVFSKLDGLSPLPVSDVQCCELPWEELPDGVNLIEEHLPASRLERKQRQVENMIAALKTVVKPGDSIVEFCCGSGHVALVAAFVFPESTVILLDSKQKSLQRALERAETAKLTNVAFCLCNMEHFTAEFDVGTALHACGTASDLILDKCRKLNASYVVAPCCYGAISFVKPNEEAGDAMEFSFCYPQSSKFKELLDYENYLRIAHSSDQNHDGDPKEEQGRFCMALVDSDRTWAAAEKGFDGQIMRMTPHGKSSLKDHVLVGRRPEAV